MWDSRAEAETAPPSVTTAGAVIAQNAGLAHGLAWVIAPTAGPDRWEAICCSQLAGVARWTWSHKSGRPTGNIWPLSSSVATSLTSESFMRAPEYTTWCQWWCQRSRRWPLRASARFAAALWRRGRHRWLHLATCGCRPRRRAVSGQWADSARPGPAPPAPRVALAA